MARDSRAWGNMHASRGVTLLLLRRGPEALENLRVAVDSLSRALGPKHRLTLGARLNHTLALAQVGRTDEATAEVAILGELREVRQAALNFEWVTARVARLSRRPAEALTWYRQALEKVSDNPVRPWNRMRFLVDRGLAEVDLGLADEARASIQEGLDIASAELRREIPMHAEAWVGLGRALMIQHRRAEALDHFRRADAFWRRTDPDNPSGEEPARWLARALLSFGARAESAEVLTRAERLHASAPGRRLPPSR